MKQDTIPEENAMAQVVFHRMKKPESQERQTLNCVLEKQPEPFLPDIHSDTELIRDSIPIIDIMAKKRDDGFSPYHCKLTVS